MTTLTQLQLNQTDINCGMSYIFLLDNRHFFIIDGGFFTPGEDEKLYEWLCAHCEGKPEIDGWFFSHPHQDHIGVLINMMKSHRRDLIIQKLIFNFQHMELPNTCEGWEIKSNDLATIRKFYDTLDEYCIDIPIITPHTGDLLEISELTIHVLYTHEDLNEPATINDQSTVIRTDICGQRILFPGDIGEKGSEILLHAREQLKSDIVQVAHHGFNGATTEFYEAVDAKVALWPTPDYCISDLRKRDPNCYLLDRSKVKEHIFSGYGTRDLILPYLSAEVNKKITSSSFLFR